MTLAGVVEEVNDAALFDRPLSRSRRAALVRYLASRQGQPGSYHGLFAPEPGEIEGDYRFYTGERMSTDAGARHILGEEALRALVMLKPLTKEGQAAAARAAAEMAVLLDRSEQPRNSPHSLRGRGVYCCGRCSLALARACSADAFPASKDRLKHNIAWLRSKRDGKGTWAGLPFAYAVAALVAAGTKPADAELRYARPAVERRLGRRAAGDDVYERRRRRLYECAAARAAGA